MEDLTLPKAASPAPRPGSRLVEATRYAAADGGPRRELVAEERPVALSYNWFSFAVMLATPSDFEDFAVGFSLTEEIVGDASEISGLKVRLVEDAGVEINVTITSDRYMALRERHRRNIVAGTSCGICGSDSFSEALRPLAPVRSAAAFAPAAIQRAMAEFPSLQRLNHDVGAVHAAAFADADGRIVATREDIGRHNALDKLIGHLARHAIDPGSGFAVVSSRCSFEMVHKVTAAGIPLIASVSAPTSLAINIANDSQVGLCAFAREGRFTLYATPSRIKAL